MNREVIFRGRRKETNEWEYGAYYFIDGRGFIVHMEQYIPDTRDWDLSAWYEDNPSYIPCSIEVVPESVGQWVGLQDKNGEEIFENDILKYYVRQLDGTDKEFNGIVSYDEGEFHVDKYPLNTWLWDSINGNTKLIEVEVVKH